MGLTHFLFLVCLAFSVIKTGDPEWFFFCILHCKYSKGSRSNRTTAEGFWKPTGQDRDIKAARYGEVIGKKKTLVYHYGRSPTAIKTNWVIHEYRTDVAGVPAQVCYACPLFSIVYSVFFFLG